MQSGEKHQQHKGCRFTVQVERDETADEMKDLFYEVSKPGDPAKTVQEGDDSFVCCISSHGGWDPDLNKDVVFGQTEVEIAIGPNRIPVPKGALDIDKHAYEIFSPSKNGCTTLEGKPKCFFNQTCQGEKPGIVGPDRSGSCGTSVSSGLPNNNDYQKKLLFVCLCHSTRKFSLS